MADSIQNRQDSQLRIYSDFTTRFNIFENNKMSCFTDRRFTCGGIRFHHDIQISEWLTGEAIPWQLSEVRFLVGLREATPSEKIIKLKTLLTDDTDIK